LKEHEEVLTGSCGPDEESGVPVTGEVRGRHVTWRFDIALEENGPKHTVTFTSTLDDSGTLLTGSFTVANFGGDFTARKQGVRDGG
jgi:hypothetical protein